MVSWFLRNWLFFYLFYRLERCLMEALLTKVSQIYDLYCLFSYDSLLSCVCSPSTSFVFSYNLNTRFAFSLEGGNKDPLWFGETSGAKSSPLET